MAEIAASRIGCSRVGSSILILDILRLKLQLGRDRALPSDRSAQLRIVQQTGEFLRHGDDRESGCFAGFKFN